MNLRIDEKGDVFIIAPHYQVNEEDAFTPLSRQTEIYDHPPHRPPMSVSLETASPSADPQMVDGPQTKEDKPPMLAPASPKAAPAASETAPTPAVAAPLPSATPTAAGSVPAAAATPPAGNP